MYCWGNTVNGELGLGGIEEEQVHTPKPSTWSQAKDVVLAACGYNHTLFLTACGHVFSCGSNDYGQLGHDQPRKRPQLVSSLDAFVIKQVSCGSAHSVAISEWGQLFSWGSDSHGQLGLAIEHPFQPTPKIVKGLALKHVIQICCGQNHTMALTNNGELYTWGANNFGQLGLGYTSDKQNEISLVKSLAGIPISFLACGGNHSFAVTRSGAVFGWGRNTSGQLGLNDEQNRSYPSHLKTLRNIRVSHVACGEDFSVFLTLDGGVLTCGDGTCGQLGHGGTTNEILPRKIMELMGSTITQITCGRRHTVVLVSSRGRIYGFGLGGSGQLGVRVSRSVSTPQVVVGPWVSPDGTVISTKSIEDINIRRIFAGGNHCFASVCDNPDDVEDDRLPQHSQQILSITPEIVEKFKNVPKDVTLDNETLTNIETIFRSQACINSSFLLKNFEHYCCSSRHHGVNMDEATAIFEVIACLQHDRIKEFIFEAITSEVIPSLSNNPPDVETLRVYLTLPLYHEFCNAKRYKLLHIPFGRALLNLTKNPQRIVIQWWAAQGTHYIERLVTVYKEVVVYILNKETSKECSTPKRPLPNDAHMHYALDVLARLNKINRDNLQLSIPHSLFHLPDLCEQFDIQADYLHWMHDTQVNDSQSRKFYFCNYPFVFDAQAKTLLLQIDQAVQMHAAMNEAANQGLFLYQTGLPFSVSQFITLGVSRENIVQDTLRELGRYGASDLKKPLKIKFIGEEAEDAGGVRKEFFILLLKEILDPKFGMFKDYEETRTMWFSEASFEDEVMYFLIGLICGLAIYNFTIINLPFPLALYKKLLGEPVTLSDLADLSTSLAKSLQTMIEYDGDDLEEVFCVNFEVSREVYGEVKIEPLKPGGSSIPVTQENKQEFVNLYVDFVLNKSVEKHFVAFQNGFLKVCGGKVMELFQPDELMAVVIGNEDYDWVELENSAEYKNGYTSGDQTIRWFWEVFHELALEEKKKFLLFLTGSDRIPIQGTKAIKIYFQPTADDRCLPVAHTCFNLLDLPRYGTKERLKYKLLQAIQQTQGFSLV